MRDGPPDWRPPRPRSWPPGALGSVARLRLVGSRVLVAQAIDVGPARLVGGVPGSSPWSDRSRAFVQDHVERPRWTMASDSSSAAASSARSVWRPAHSRISRVSASTSRAMSAISAAGSSRFCSSSACNRSIRVRKLSEATGAPSRSRQVGRRRPGGSGPWLRADAGRMVGQGVSSRVHRVSASMVRRLAMGCGMCRESRQPDAPCRPQRPPHGAGAGQGDWWRWGRVELPVQNPSPETTTSVSDALSSTVRTGIGTLPDGPVTCP